MLVEIPAGSKLYVYFYVQKFEDLRKIDTLTIEFSPNVPNIPKRNLLGNLPPHLEVYGPFEETADCSITFNNTGKIPIGEIYAQVAKSATFYYSLIVLPLTNFIHPLTCCVIEKGIKGLV